MQSVYRFVIFLSRISVSLILYFLLIIPSAILHEYMHGWVADRLGDPTARYAGRLTLNPKAHIDPWGTILMPLLLFFATGGRFLFAYAKPVPFNPYNLKYQRFGPLMVAIAGPLSNLFLAFIFGLTVRFGGVTNLTPFFSAIVYTNVLLAVFNLVPIPPLDGSKVLYALLPDSLWKVKTTLEQYGIWLLLIFMFFFFPVIEPVVNVLYWLFVGAPPV